MGAYAPNENLRAPGANKGMSSAPITGIPAGRGASPAASRFSVENAGMPQPAAAVTPGRGAIPVEPGHGGAGGNDFDQARADAAGTLRMPRGR
jgi:hypothetical protein